MVRKRISWAKKDANDVKVKGEWSGTVEKIGQRNILTDFTNRFPLSEADFEGEEGELVIYLLSGSPGLFNGDHQVISCWVKENAHLYLTDPSATELHPSLVDEPGIQQINFRFEKNSILEYVPEPIIPFCNSDFKGKTTVHMAEGSQAIIGEIVTAGRVGHDESFMYRQFCSQLEVYFNEHLTVWDSFRFDPEEYRAIGLEGPWGGYTHMATLWILSEQINQTHLQFIQETLQNNQEGLDTYGGASLLHKNGMVIRLLGYSAQELEKVTKVCWDYFRQELFKKAPLEILK